MEKHNRTIIIGIWLTTILFFFISPILNYLSSLGWVGLLSAIIGFTGWHQAATLFIYFDNDATRLIKNNSLNYIYIPIFIIISLGYIFLVLPNRFDYYFLLFYGAITIWHYQRQNWGIYNLYIKLSNLKKNTLTEKKLVHLGMIPGLMGFWLIFGNHDESVIHNTFFYPYISIFTAIGEIFLFVLCVLFTLWIIKNYQLWSMNTNEKARVLLLFIMVSFYWPLYFIDNKILAFSMFAGSHGIQYYLLVAILSSKSSFSILSKFKLYSNFKKFINILLMFTMSYVFFKLFWEINTYKFLNFDSSILHMLTGVGLGFSLCHYYLDSKFWRVSNPDSFRYMQSKLFSIET